MDSHSNGKEFSSFNKESIKVPSRVLATKLCEINEAMDEILFKDPQVREMFMYTPDIQEKRMKEIENMKKDVDDIKKRLERLSINDVTTKLMEKVEDYIGELMEFEHECREHMQGTAAFRDNIPV